MFSKFGTMIDRYQSNNREYMVLAKPSRLTVAPRGSRLLLITSSGVIMTRLHNASSSASGSHLCINRRVKIVFIMQWGALPGKRAGVIDGQRTWGVSLSFRGGIWTSGRLWPKSLSPLPWRSQHFLDEGWLPRPGRSPPARPRICLPRPWLFWWRGTPERRLRRRARSSLTGLGSETISGLPACTSRLPEKETLHMISQLLNNNLQLRSSVKGKTRRGAEENLRGSWAKKVKAMVVPLRVRDLTDSRSLQKIRSYGSTRYSSTVVELNLDKFTEPAARWHRKKTHEGKRWPELPTRQDSTDRPGVVVSHCFRISKCFKDRIRLHLHIHKYTSPISYKAQNHQTKKFFCIFSHSMIKGARITKNGRRKGGNRDCPFMRPSMEWSNYL